MIVMLTASVDSCNARIAELGRQLVDSKKREDESHSSLVQKGLDLDDALRRIVELKRERDALREDAERFNRVAEMWGCGRVELDFNDDGRPRILFEHAEAAAVIFIGDTIEDAIDTARLEDVK